MDTFLSSEATKGVQTTVYRLLVNIAQDEFHLKYVHFTKSSCQKSSPTPQLSASWDMFYVHSQIKYNTSIMF